MMSERERNQERHIPSGVRERFTILHAGWELDNVGWIANDGRVYTTSHGGAPFPMSMDKLKAKIEETTERKRQNPCTDWSVRWRRWTRRRRANWNDPEGQPG